ncbi:hypothetical protein [Amycolatopsis nigrescens]|uniref:hypothetical protein n=1 Tax=Amycolatopsis nigrescens TaxID=381445 RepID=UPI0003746C9C|nr:hypothetical protein [Amycolatopsis nigrescens]
MTELQRSAHLDDDEEPGPVRSAFGLWVAAATLTVLIALLSLTVAGDNGRSADVGGSVPGLVLMLAGIGWTIFQFGRGRPAARLLLTGLAVYFVWALVVDLTILSGEVTTSAVVPIAALLEVARAICVVVAGVAAYTRSARAYFAGYDVDAPRAGAAGLPGWVWAAGIAAVAGQLAVGFVHNLPSDGRGWEDWVTGGDTVTALQTSLVLCLVPAWAALVRWFRFGRQWARVTLTVLGSLCAVVEVFVILDALDPDNSDDLAVTYAVLGGVQLAALVLGVALSYLPAVNAHFRVARDTRRPDRPL